MAKNEGMRSQVRDTMLPQEVLRSDETVHDVAVGALRSDTFPQLLVTDQRVLYVMHCLWGWKVLHEAPAALSGPPGPTGGRLCRSRATPRSVGPCPTTPQ